MIDKFFNKFITKANLKHNNFYSYSEFNYTNAKTKSIIICPIHGRFLQSPDKHLQSTYSCPDCLSEHKKTVRKGCKPPKPAESLSKADYLLRVGEIPYVLDLSKYEGLTKGTVSITCHKHGVHTSSPSNFLVTKHKCPRCASEHTASLKLKTYDDFISKANSVHSNYYTYPESNKDTYINRKSIVNITCPIHGDFSKSAQKHLLGQGCFRCRVDRLIKDKVLLGGYNEGYFTKYPNKRGISAVIYYLKVGDYYKVGITTDLRSRIKSIKSESKLEVNIIEVVNTSLYTAWKAEQLILEEHSTKRIKLPFSTEIFTMNVLENKSISDYC